MCLKRRAFSWVFRLPYAVRSPVKATVNRSWGLLMFHLLKDCLFVFSLVGFKQGFITTEICVISRGRIRKWMLLMSSSTRAGWIQANRGST